MDYTARFEKADVWSKGATPKVFDRSPLKTARGAPNIIDGPIRIRK